MSKPHDSDSLLSDDVRERHAGHPLIPALPRAARYSRFLRRNLELDAGLGEWILAHPASRRFVSGSIAESVAASLRDLEEIDALHRESRRLRRNAMSLIAWADLVGVYRLADTLAAVSELADSLIDTVLGRLYRELVKRHGTPIGAESGEPVSMVVLGLGKLGGRELNFSSDVDLIFSFSEPGQTDGAKAVTNGEFFIKLGQRLVKFLDEPTAGGFLFRTDMRLRPNGASGPLALSFDAMEHYYQTHGRDWERYALIKARVVAGDREGGARLLKLLRPFVYRKYLDFSAFESIRDMKRLIDRELERKRRSRDIKLGHGGIREIEFIVQSHQLIRGGREPALQTSSLYAAFDALVCLDVIAEEERDALIAAYEFLRNTEHRLQMYDDAQTQRLPDDEARCGLLAESMGFNEWSEFEAALHTHQEFVHGQFASLFQTEADADGRRDDGFADVWFATRGDDACRRFLAERGFDDPERALAMVRGIRQGRVYQSFSRNGRERLDRMIPPALEEIAAAKSPDQSLVRFITVIEGIGRRSAYFALLAENSLALKQLIQLIGTSAWVARWIGQHPVILDELLDPIANARLMTPAKIRGELERRLEPVAEDLEAQMDVLREYKNGYFLRVAALAMAGVVEPLEVRRGLTDLADALVESSIPCARASLTAKVREQVESIRERLMFGVVGYGKLGGRELSYNSDLDLVFLFDCDPPAPAEMDPVLGYYHSRLAQRVMHMLNTTTRAGVLYETDIRLRPSGRSGTMVNSINAFREYQLQQAWTWEHQALVRSRMVAGPAELVERFETVRTHVLAQPRDRAELAREVADMRAKMSRANDRSTDSEFDIKLGEGGIVDIEFLVQYHVLAEACEHPDILDPRGTVEILAALAAAGLMDADESRALERAYREYLTRELELKLEEREPLIDADELREARDDVSASWRRRFGDA